MSSIPGLRPSHKFSSNSRWLCPMTLPIVNSRLLSLQRSRKRLETAQVMASGEVHEAKFIITIKEGNLDRTCLPQPTTISLEAFT